MNDPVDTVTIRVEADTSDFQKGLEIATSSGRQFSRALISSFEGVTQQGKGMGFVLDTMTQAISRMTLQAAFRPLDQAMSGIIGNLLSGQAFGSSFRLGFANGGVLSHGTPVPFASGGVISSPISFPLAGGATGIAGERGAEAIMPLTRGPDGRLGVQSSGGGGGVNVTFNVTAADADSFRRTETQISAMLARAVSQGQRNL